MRPSRTRGDIQYSPLPRSPRDKTHVKRIPLASPPQRVSHESQKLVHAAASCVSAPAPVTETRLDGLELAEPLANGCKVTSRGEPRRRKDHKPDTAKELDVALDCDKVQEEVGL